jgi:glycosyltransferase involved in cell wall biosynthesis
VRILVVNYEYPPLGGGGGMLTQTLVTELAADHDVTVITSRGPGTLSDSYEAGARILRVPVLGRSELPRASLPSLVSFGPAARRAGARLLSGRRFDVVHAFFAVPSGPAGAALARRARAPFVLTLVGADVYDPTRSISPERFAPLRRVVRRVVEAAACVTAISTDIASRAEAITARSGIEVIPCGIPQVPLPQRRRPAGGEVIFLTIARLVRRKALDAVVRSVPEGAHVVVIGDGPERRALEGAALPGRVTFTGPLGDPDKTRHLVNADAFVLASLHEGFGLVYLEAMRAGLPVIAGTTGGQTDFLRDGENALLVGAGDAAGIHDAMRRLASDDALRARLGAAGRTTAARFTARSMAQAYEAVYARVRPESPAPEVAGG